MNGATPTESPRFRRAVYALVAGSAAASLAGVAFAPYLLVHHPALLIALAPEGRHLVLAAGRVDWEWLLLIGTVRRVLALVGTFGLGLVWGDAMHRFIERRAPRMAKLVRWLDRQFLRFGAPLLLVFPMHTLVALAGVARTRFFPVLAAVLAGQAALVGGTLWFGDAVALWTAPIVAFLTDHVLETTLVCVAAVVLQQLWSRWRGASAAPSLPEPDAR